MGVPVLIMGASGSGKSASLRNFEPDEIGILMLPANHCRLGSICRW